LDRWSDLLYFFGSALNNKVPVPSPVPTSSAN